MENFFWNDTFYRDIEELILDISEEDDLSDLDDNWSIKCSEGILEPMFQISAESIFQYFGGEERDDENGDAGERAIDILNKYIDFEKVNEMIPKLYYFKNGKDFTITKQDLLAWL